MAIPSSHKVAVVVVCDTRSYHLTMELTHSEKRWVLRLRDQDEHRTRTTADRLACTALGLWSLWF